MSAPDRWLAGAACRDTAQYAAARRPDAGPQRLCAGCEVRATCLGDELTTGLAPGGGVAEPADDPTAPFVETLDLYVRVLAARCVELRAGGQAWFFLPSPAGDAHGAAPAGRTCQHTPACPRATAPDRDAARVIRTHPDQGWSLLCNGVVLFEDTGAILPTGQTVEPHRGLADLLFDFGTTVIQLATRYATGSDDVVTAFQAHMTALAVLTRAETAACGTAETPDLARLRMRLLTRAEQVGRTDPIQTTVCAPAAEHLAGAA